MPYHNLNRSNSPLTSSPRSPSPLRSSFDRCGGNYSRNNTSRSSFESNPFNSTPRPGSPSVRSASPLAYTHPNTRPTRASFSNGQSGQYASNPPLKPASRQRSSLGGGQSGSTCTGSGGVSKLTPDGTSQSASPQATRSSDNYSTSRIPRGHRHTQSLNHYQLPAPPTPRREVYERPSRESLVSTSSTTTTEISESTTAATSQFSAAVSNAAAAVRGNNVGGSGFRLLTPAQSVSSFVKTTGQHTPSPRRIGVTFAQGGSPQASPQTNPGPRNPDSSSGVAPSPSGRIVEISSSGPNWTSSPGPGPHTPSPRGSSHTTSHRKRLSLNLQGSSSTTTIPLTPSRSPTLSKSGILSFPSTPLSFRFQHRDKNHRSPSSNQRHKGSPLTSLKLEPSPIRAPPTVAMTSSIIHAPRPKTYDEGRSYEASYYPYGSPPEPSPDFQQYTQVASTSYFTGRERSLSRDEAGPRPGHGHSKSVSSGSTKPSASLFNSAHAPNAPIARPPSRSENLLRHALTRDEQALANLSSMPTRSRGGSLSHVLPSPSHVLLSPSVPKRRASDADGERALSEDAVRAHHHLQSPPRFTRNQTTPVKTKRPSSPLALQRSPHSDPFQSQNLNQISPPLTSPVLKARLERALSANGRQRPSPSSQRSKSQDPRQKREEDRRYAEHLAEEERLEARRALDEAKARVERSYAVNGDGRKRGTIDSQTSGWPWRELESDNGEHRLYSPPHSSHSSRNVPRTPISPRHVEAVASPRSTPLPLTPPPTPPATHAAPLTHRSSSSEQEQSRRSSYDSLSQDRPSTGSSFKPFNVRTASAQCCQMDGYVSFASVEGLGLPPGDDDEREDSQQKKGGWFGFKSIPAWGWGSESP